jgi:hypothetical protein
VELQIGVHQHHREAHALEQAPRLQAGDVGAVAAAYVEHARGFEDLHGLPHAAV